MADSVVLTLDEMRSMATLYRDANLVHASASMTRALFADDAKIKYNVTYEGKNLSLDLNVTEMMEHLQKGQYENTVSSEVLEEVFEIVSDNVLKYLGKVKTTRLGHGLIEEKDQATYLIESSIIVGFKIVDGRILIEKLENTYTKNLVSNE